MKGGPRYYRVDKQSGLARWEPPPKMRAAGYRVAACGADGPDARANAERFNAYWDIWRKGNAVSDVAAAAVGLPHEKIEKVKADGTLTDLRARVQYFAGSSAARYLAKELRQIAGEIEQAARLRAAEQSHRDFLLVAS
jgi:hypothetical protein